jgi:DNA repair protein RecO (recombination protein O)
MLISTQGIVFKSIKFQESSLIVKIFTKTHGVLTFMVKGVRSVKANGKAAAFQPGVLLDLIMYFQENKNFKTLKEFKSAHLYSSTLFDVRKSSVLIFLMEILEQCIKEDEDNEQIFEFIFNALVALDETDFKPSFHIDFLLELMQHLGIFPSGQASDITPYFNTTEGSFSAHASLFPYQVKQEESASFSKALKGAAASLNRQQRNKVLSLILDYFSYHIDNFKEVRSLKVLEAVLA